MRRGFFSRVIHDAQRPFPATPARQSRTEQQTPAFPNTELPHQQTGTGKWIDIAQNADTPPYAIDRNTIDSDAADQSATPLKTPANISQPAHPPVTQSPVTQPATIQPPVLQPSVMQQTAIQKNKHKQSPQQHTESSQGQPAALFGLQTHTQAPQTHETASPPARTAHHHTTPIADKHRLASQSGANETTKHENKIHPTETHDPTAHNPITNVLSSAKDHAEDKPVHLDPHEQNHSTAEAMHTMASGQLNQSTHQPANRTASTSTPEPHVHIGRINVVVVNEPKTAPPAQQASPTHDFSSRHYLRRL